MTLVETPLAARDAAKKAALKNYEHQKWTPDRPGWTGGKCPVTEYFGKLAEIGGAEYTGFGWQNLCLYSPNRSDYSKPDMGTWDVKAGGTFNDHDIAKGVEHILWVTPLATNHVFYCGYDTCNARVHTQLSGVVLVRGWTPVTDKHLCEDRGNFYRLTDEALRSVDTLPEFAWAVSA